MAAQTLPIRTRAHRRAITAALLALCAVAAALTLSGCGSSEDEPTAAEQAEYEGKTLYEYNLDRGAMALNDYDYESGLETFNGLCYYSEDDAVTSSVGIDVSDHQDAINWSKLAASGIDFAFLRAGYRGYTEGGLNTDANFTEDAQEALDAGLDVGVYFFSQATDENEAREEAEYVVDLLDGLEITYPVTYDLETDVAEDARTADLTSDEITACAIAFCEAVEEAGYTPMIYMNKNAATHQFDLSQLQDYLIWYAEYADQPSLGFRFSLWQYSDEGSAFGIDGNVDLDILFDTSEFEASLNDSAE